MSLPDSIAFFWRAMEPRTTSSGRGSCRSAGSRYPRTGSGGSMLGSLEPGGVPADHLDKPRAISQRAHVMLRVGVDDRRIVETGCEQTVRRMSVPDPCLKERYICRVTACLGPERYPRRPSRSCASLSRAPRTGITATTSAAAPGSSRAPSTRSSSGWPNEVGWRHAGPNRNEPAGLPVIFTA